MKRLVFVESPFAGRGNAGVSDGMSVLSDLNRDAFANADYVRELCRFLAERGDAPYASHVFCTEFLDDGIPTERALGIEIGLAWGKCAAVTVVGVDRGISTGMRYGIERARAEGRPVEWLSLTAWRDSWLPAGVERVDIDVVSAEYADRVTITHGGAR